MFFFVALKDASWHNTYHKSSKKEDKMEKIKEGFLRVTTPLSAFTDFSSIPPHVLQHAADRGTKVHKLCELTLLDEYFPQPEEELKGYLNSFNEWKDTLETIHRLETRYYSDMLKITGAIDIIGTVKGDKSPSIIDIKTAASESKTWCLQLAAYQHLFNSNIDTQVKAERRFALHLKKNGKRAKIIEYTDHDRDLDLYLSALKIWRYFNG